MSYEGYYQIVCERHHSRSEDCYENPNFEAGDEPFWQCSCGAKAAWWNLCDTTNGSWCEHKDNCPDATETITGNPEKCNCDNGRIDGHIELEVLEEQVTETCPHCNHTRIVKEKTYKIPENKGHRV